MDNRFHKNFTKKICTQKAVKQTVLMNELTIQEESIGELKLLQLIQSVSYPEEIASLQNQNVLKGHFEKLDPDKNILGNWLTSDVSTSHP